MFGVLAEIELAQYPVTDFTDDQLKWAVVVCRYQQQWLLVKHKQRDTFESPGGKREVGESIRMCAERELFEESGALEFELTELAPYSIKLSSGELSYGQLFFADISRLGPLPDSEMESVCLFKDLPSNHTYPKVHPFLINLVKQKFSID